MTVRSRPDSPARGWLRGREWERITRGVYAAALSRTQVEELAAWQLILPRTAAFSHLTAARLRGWWLPATIAHPVFAAMLNADPRPRRPGLLVCRHTQPFPMNLVNGLRITTAAETILAAARDLGVLDLVILGDSALRLRHCTLTDLEITARQRRRGAPLLRQVIPLLDARSESAWESIMRVLHQAAEIPVTPQQEIFDEQGRFIARADLRIDGTRRIHEYDGAEHREADVHEVDLERDRALLGCALGAARLHLKTPAARRRHNHRRRRPPARTDLESASAGCVAGPARPLAPRTGRPRPRVPQLAASHCRNRSDATRRRPQSGWYVTGYVKDGSGALLATLTLGELFAWHQSRQYRVPDDFISDDHLGDVVAAGNVVHDIEQNLFEDRPQPAGARATQ